jgi:site-specific DNA recombinase
MTTAALYTRFSSDRQREASSEDQARNCRRRIEAEGWQLAHHYRDEAISGAKAARPQYQAMLHAALAGEFDVLLVDDLSRLARDSLESERAIRRLEFAGLRIIAVSDGYDTASKAATRKVVRGIKGMMNELRLDELREQVHRGLTGQALQKFWCGGRPYGYKLVQVTDSARRDVYGNPAVIGTRLEVDAAAATVVREIYQHYADEWSMAAIAGELNRRGVASPGTAWRNRRVRRASKWVASGVASILENELYSGDYVWNKTIKSRDPETGARRVRQRPPAEQIRAHLPELRIVPAEVWNRVLIRRARANARGAAIRAAIQSRGRGPKFLFSSILHCGECGASLVVVGGAANYYGCGSHKLGGRHACGNDLTVKRAVVESRLLEPIKSALLDEEILAEIELRYRKAVATASSAPKTDAVRLAQLRTEVENLTDAIALGALRSSPAIAQRLAKAEAEVAALEAAQRPAPRPQRAVVDLRTRGAARYRRRVRELETALNRDVGRARAIVRELVGGKIPCFPNKEREHLVAHLPTGAEACFAAAAGGSQIIMVPGIGLEPTTRALRMRCSTN